MQSKDKANKIFNTSPLPFIGQKRNFIKKYRQILKANIPNDGEGWTIIDVFGGSGLLAHNAKRLKPKARVIYNDYDGFSDRVKHINDTNHLRSILFRMLNDYPRNMLLDKTTKQKVLDAINNFDGYVDTHTIATWVLFSGKQIKSLAEMSNQSFYNRIRKTDITTADGYLDGLEITQESFTTLMPRFARSDKIIFVLDPPYLNTSQGAYKQDRYFSMVDFLQMMQHIRPPYLFFSSTKSELPAYLNFIATARPKEHQKLGDYHHLSQSATINKNVKYEDNLIYCF